MEGEKIKKRGLLILIIGVIMLACVLFTKIKNNIYEKNNSNKIENSTAQLERIQISNNEEYVKIIEQYFKYLEQKNTTEMFKLFPKFTNISITELEQLIKQAHNAFESECGTNINLSYNINSGDKYNSEAITKLEEELKKQYSNFDQTITEVYRLKIYIKISGDSGVAERETYMYVGKIDNNWFLF